MRCMSGLHEWTDQADAEKCCHPDWKRILLVGNDAFKGSETPLQYACGTVYGRKWVRNSTLASKPG